MGLALSFEFATLSPRYVRDSKRLNKRSDA